MDKGSQYNLQEFLKKKLKKSKDLKIFTDHIEEPAREQIDRLLEQEAFQDSKIRIMPDVHAGKDCVIGFTGDLGEKVIPSIVGGDIGCGMFCANLGPIDIDYSKLDAFIQEHIPSGQDVYSEKVVHFDFTRLYCYPYLKNMGLLENSLGTLGGGNHFIEIDESKDGEKYLIIHSGSRNLGAQVARYYQNLADQICNHGLLEMKEKVNSLIAEYRSSGREHELEEALKDLREQFNHSNPTPKVPFEFAYLEGVYRDAYLHDMQICQEYAAINRLTIASRIADYMGWSIRDYFESVHNYISEDRIVRKGAISAKEGEPVIIPMNMRDGCIIGMGKGNPDWNYSAPHGAGRVMSRKEASEKVDMEEYKESMQGIFTTSVTEDTVDESPFAYKPSQEIIDRIGPTVMISEVLKPVYNFKASGTRLRKEREDMTLESQK
ncbi:MAG: RtcB family protein [Bacilli bacterium]|nr:RtcB family protein [Bacilli bacterium]